MAGIDLGILNTELTTDPEGVGYAGNEVGVQTRMVNEQGIVSGDVIDVTFIQPTELQTAVVGSEYTALQSVERDLWGALIGSGAVNGVAIRDSNIRLQLRQVWSAGTTTRANIGSMQSRPASRVEITHSEENLVATKADVNAALRL